MPAVHAYVSLLARELLAVPDGQVLAVYLHGSGALGGWRPEVSDVDVLVVVGDHVSAAAARVLGMGAAGTAGACPGTGLELSIVARAAAAAPSPPWPFVVHVAATNVAQRLVVLGEGHPGDPDLLLHYAVCRASGTAAHGPPAAEVVGPVPRPAVLAALADELEWGLTHAAPHYALLNACRALVYLHDGRLVAKPTGGQWAIDQLVGQPDGVRRALAAQTGGLPATSLSAADVEFVGLVAEQLRAAAIAVGTEASD